MSRKTNVLTYLNEWRDGSWYMRKPEDLPHYVADETVAYADLPDTTANLHNYSDTVEDMLADGTLTVTDHGNGFITLDVA